MVGFGSSIPYFWAISKDKDMTISPKMYANENMIFLMNIDRRLVNLT